MFTLVQIVLYRSVWFGVLDETAGNVTGFVRFAIRVYFRERPLILKGEGCCWLRTVG